MGDDCSIDVKCKFHIHCNGHSTLDLHCKDGSHGEQHPALQYPAGQLSLAFAGWAGLPVDTVAVASEASASKHKSSLKQV